jgi:NAD dependent epimerase/dehydratase family enzyme
MGGGFFRGVHASGTKNSPPRRHDYESRSWRNFRHIAAIGSAGSWRYCGSGNQFVSWIHAWDFVRAVDFLIAKEQTTGGVNLAALFPLTNREFRKVLRQAYGQKSGLPASRWMLELGAFFLRTETELILKSRRVVPGRLLDAGFEFKFPDWSSAARDLVHRWQQDAAVNPLPSTQALAAEADSRMR